jgi:hypothetical protein
MQCSEVEEGVWAPLQGQGALFQYHQGKASPTQDYEAAKGPAEAHCEDQATGYDRVVYRAF